MGVVARTVPLNVHGIVELLNGLALFRTLHTVEWYRC